MKVLFIAPHLSTGGMPQYLYKQIEALSESCEVWCIEWDNVTGGVLVVQRNRIVNLLGNRLITLGEKRENLFSFIKTINPDVIHLQEIPEMFMPYNIALRLYNLDRTYTIVETSHDSSFDINNKLHFPDRFAMVSQYQVETYKPLNIPCDLVEYPIEYHKRTKTREELLDKLGLDPNKKHVITVGLFTPRKNQAEVIEYAKQLKDYPIQFHFIGNQADNFKYYWEPLMKDFPSNCKWWGERSDVDIFYQMADLFLFTSRGHATDKETMPLVIREAISWQVPSLIYNLDVYLNYFDKHKNIEYLNFNSKEDNIKIILNKLNINETHKMETYEFWSRWEPEEQKMHFGTMKDIHEPVIICLREYMSDGVFWSCKYDSMHPGGYWMIPISKNTRDYEKDPYYSGIKIGIYRQSDNKRLYEYPYFSKFVDIPRITLSNTIPYHFNYLEFFVLDKYKRFFKDKKFKNVVDVGANVGVFTSYLIYNEFTNKIISIECDSNALKDLIHNFRLDPRVTIIPKAFHHENTLLSFYESEDNPVISSAIPPEKLKNHMAGVKGDREVKVETVTIDNLLSEYGLIDLLKIDIEGGEYNIIEHFKPEWFEYVNNMLIECHFFEENYKEQYNALINRLESIGYVVEEFQENQSDVVGTSEMIFVTKK
jgi:FkbM family methyltransferase